MSAARRGRDARGKAPAPGRGGPERFEPVKVLGKSFAILEALQEQPAGTGRLKVLTERVGLPKATVFRLLRTLEGLRYVAFDEETEAYGLTERLRKLGSAESEPLLKRLAKPAMTRLVAEFEQTVNLATVEEGQLVYKDVEQGVRNVRMRPTPGVQLCWRTTALGKSILAFCPQGQALSLLRLSQRQIEQERYQRLWDELGRARTMGFALDLEESEPGLCCVAAPIFGQPGEPVAAISVSGSSRVITTRALPSIGSRLIEECAAISAAIGFRGSVSAKRPATRMQSAPP